MSDFVNIIQKYRKESFSEKAKGTQFERLIKAFLLTSPKYAHLFSDVWLWEEFPARNDFGGKDVGIDIVCRTNDSDFWAVQCKCYKETVRIAKPDVDTFLSTSSRTFIDADTQNAVQFSYRLWIDTTVKGFNPEAENTIHNQIIPVGRINLYDLENSGVDWNLLENGSVGKEAQTKKYLLKEHQSAALQSVHTYFQTHDRGKLIMACGTGKTFTSLKIAENETMHSGLVLFLVPSIALLGQTLNEWSAQSLKPIHPLCICSDTHVSKNNKANDASGVSSIDLALPASTNIKNITRQYKRAIKNQKKNGGMVVVFSTYQSIDVISSVQEKLNEQESHSCIFDLIICDEAHRTTGVTLKDKEESHFVKVHKNVNIEAKKRLYMTATPRLYGENSIKKAQEKEAELCSMDDAELYGDEIYRIGFGEAVEKQLLSDYKVIVLTLDENQLTKEIYSSISEKNEEINADDALKLIGCINALSKITNNDEELFKSVDPEPMHSAVAFCQNIKISEETRDAMNTCRDVYLETLTDKEKEKIVQVQADHVDGGMSAAIRNEKLQKLRDAKNENNTCNILMNVRCLSEGVDVPSLDAVLFLSAKNSQVDVVQSVGRVMRRSEGKKYGYIIIPVVVPTMAEPEKILEDHDRFKIVWSVLNALRAHDDRFNATINSIDLNKKKPSKIKVARTNLGGFDTENDDAENDEGEKLKTALQQQLELQFEELQTVIYAKMVEKCGDRLYWENWAKDIAKIAEKHTEHIHKIIAEDEKAKNAFEKYLFGLHKNINPSVSKADAIEMLAQHIITGPVFEALFENYSFVKNNPVSHSMQDIVELLNEKTNKEDLEKLERFYTSVRQRAEKIDNAEAKQRIIIELYDKFFKTAFPKVVEKLGIVYTPIEVVDFIIHSVEAVMKKEFGRSMSDENVHILDPFTGTGTFITRLLQSGIIKNDDLERKYKKEIHANEIVLLAYYIASINIENTYHDLIEQQKPFSYSFDDDDFSEQDSFTAYDGIIAAEKPQNSIQYAQFNGICLTDTFQLGETNESLGSEFFKENTDRVLAQKNAPLKVIIGNPPYSIGQKSANDNAQNQSYEKLEKRIEETYVAKSTANLNKSAYDSYIKAFRWASDRLPKDGGIIAFVSNGAWLDANGLDGFRKCIEEEFESIYVFNLRGNQRTSGELSRKEGGKIFGSGSRTPISITILVKKGV